jgi:hypothetical protein
VILVTFRLQWAFNSTTNRLQCRQKYKKVAALRLCLDQYYSGNLTKILSCRKQHHVVDNTVVSYLVPLISNYQNIYQF